MEEIKIFIKNIFLILFLFGVFSCTNNSHTFTVNDQEGIFEDTDSPILVETKLNKTFQDALNQNRLRLIEQSEEIIESNIQIPVQLDKSLDGDNVKIAFIMPKGKGAIRKFKIIETEILKNNLVAAKPSQGNKQFVVADGNSRILQYNYQTVFENDVVRANNEKIEEYTRNERDTFIVTSIYAVPRSNYIHPLYGLEGEMLTRDWPDGGHPHHRGIFWAWPEVYYGSEMGDIYALQKLFARPTGNIELISGPVFAEIKAENFWMWEDREPIVNEKVTIRVYRSSEENRVIDLKLQFLALKDSITIATRYTDSYGGLNIRMQFPENQNISYFTNARNSKPVRAWSNFSGIFEGTDKQTGLMVLQNQQNPEYPGEWVEYPDLAWVQPTFPSPGTRYTLSKVEPLILQYRLIIHAGGEPTKVEAIKKWNAYHHNLMHLLSID